MEKQKIIQQIEPRVLAMGTKLVKITGDMGKKWNIYRLKKGLRHGKGRFKNHFDTFLFTPRMKYSIRDILTGKIKKQVIIQNHNIGEEWVDVEPPEDYYQIGRYMMLADRFIKRGTDDYCMDTVLTGARIYGWLGQGNRQSVRNKIQKAYDKAKEISTEYDIPLSVPGDCRLAVTSSDLRYGIEEFINNRS